MMTVGEYDSYPTSRLRNLVASFDNKLSMSNNVTMFYHPHNIRRMKYLSRNLLLTLIDVYLSLAL